MEIPSVTRSCNVPSCRQMTKFWCSLCRDAWYCSNDHLLADLVAHGKRCPALLSSIQTNRPVLQEAQTLAVECNALLLACDAAPSIITVYCLPPKPRDPYQRWTPDLRPYLGNTDPFVRTITARENPYPLQVFNTGSVIPNHFINGITANYTGSQWYGPLIVMRLVDSNEQVYENIKSNDENRALNWFAYN